MATVYDDLKAAGCQTDHHESDLYVLVDDTARRLIGEMVRDKRLAKLPAVFRGADDGKLWYDIPFHYQPFWAKFQQSVRDSGKQWFDYHCATNGKPPHCSVELRTHGDVIEFITMLPVQCEELAEAMAEWLNQEAGLSVP
jgi:hypothetical protein